MTEKVDNRNQNKKKILIISDADNIGGVEKRYSNLYKYLISTNEVKEDITFLVNKKLVNKIDSYQLMVKNKNVRLKIFGTSLSEKKFRILSRIIDLITVLIWAIRNKQRFDLVMFANTRSRRYSYLINAKSKVVAVYAYTLKASGKMFKKYEKLSKKGYIFDCLSEDIAKVLLSSKIIAKEKINVTPNSFIDFENTDNNFKNKNNIVSYVARFVKIKGINLLLDTIDYVLNNNNNIKFELIGYGPMETDIRTFLKKNNFTDRVIVKYSENVKEHLRKSKVFLSLQLEENYPSQSLLEAMACKNAIVATNVGLTHKLIDNGCGILVNKNGNDIGKAVLDLFDKNNLADFGENARKKILLTHTPANYYNYLLTLV